MKNNVQSMVDFIKINGYYPQFKFFCTTIPQVKSFSRKCYLFLNHIDKYKLFKYAYSINELSLHRFYEIASTPWL